MSAALEFFGMDEPTGEMTRHGIDESSDQQQQLHNMIGELVDTFAICSVPLSTEQKRLTCPQCVKTYKQMSGLKRHFSKQHKGMALQIEEEQDPCKDTMKNYCCVALGFCLLARDFRDARKHGDGAHIMLLYKFLLLHFKVAGKSKYAYQVLRLLAMRNCLLTPRMAHQLTWNRFLNFKGKPDTNIEMDRAIEHRNKLFKQECRSFHGKVTHKSVARVGQAAEALDEILYHADKVAKLKKSIWETYKGESQKGCVSFDVSHAQGGDLQTKTRTKAYCLSRLST